MDHDFKAGDKVVCVDATDCHRLLKPGAVYTVQQVINGSLLLKDDGAGVCWVPERFQPAPASEASDAVHRPNHYARYAIEPITFIMANKLPFAVGNVVKYVLRYDAKDGLQDLLKARRYIDMLIEQLTEKGAGTAP